MHPVAYGSFSVTLEGIILKQKEKETQGIINCIKILESLKSSTCNSLSTSTTNQRDEGSQLLIFFFFLMCPISAIFTTVRCLKSLTIRNL